jgi:hypothetical protein
MEMDDEFDRISLPLIDENTTYKEKDEGTF